MKKKIMGIFIAILTIGLVIPNVGASANFEKEIDEVIPYMKVYDEEFNLIESYDENEIEQFYINATDSFGASEATTYAAPLAKQHSYKATSFSSFIYVKNGDTFYDLKSIVINPARTVKKMLIRVYHGSTVARTVEVGGFSTGLNVPLGTSNSSTRYHKIQLVNGDANNSTSLKAGVVFYDVK